MDQLPGSSTPTCSSKASTIVIVWNIVEQKSTETKEPCEPIWETSGRRYSFSTNSWKMWNESRMANSFLQIFFFYSLYILPTFWHESTLIQMFLCLTSILEHILTAALVGMSAIQEPLRTPKGVVSNVHFLFWSIFVSMSSSDRRSSHG